MLNLVFLGDSLTEWFDWQGRFPQYRVTNLGISGEPVEGLLNRCERIYALIDDPDFIFVMSGINNLAMEQYDIIFPYRDIIRNLTTRHKEALIVVQSILPVDLPWISNSIIIDTNSRLEQIARQDGAEYLDIHRLFVNSEGHPHPGYLSDDGVHLAGRGYEVWAREVEKFLNDHSVSR
jgi:lysophospholipase L1-like esterase